MSKKKIISSILAAGIALSATPTEVIAQETVRDAFIAAPKALKSYFGTGLFAIVIHPITSTVPLSPWICLYCSIS